MLNDYLAYMLYKKYKVNPETDCWQWSGHRDPNGYGRISYNRDSHYAHRLSYMHHVEMIVPGQMILHSCDNPCCINPAHLRKGTHAENMQDMVDRGRSVKGREKNYVGWENAREIRMMYDTEEYTQEDLAREFNFHIDTIGNIVNYRTYRE